MLIFRFTLVTDYYSGLFFSLLKGPSVFVNFLMIHLETEDAVDGRGVLEGTEDFLSHIWALDLASSKFFVR